MNNYRQYLIEKISKNFKGHRSAMLSRGIMGNGRKLNRLSTRQLEAKVRTVEKLESQHRVNYISRQFPNDGALFAEHKHNWVEREEHTICDKCYRFDFQVNPARINTI